MPPESDRRAAARARRPTRPALNGRADLGDARRADEDAADRALTIGQLQVSLEARHLPTEGVAPYENVDEAKVVAVEEDHPGAGPEDGPRAQRLLEAVDPDQTHDRGRFAAGDDEPVEVLELLRLAHLDRLGAEAPQHGRVLAEVALDGEDSDSHPITSRGFRAALPAGATPPRGRTSHRRGPVRPARGSSRRCSASSPRRSPSRLPAGRPT